MVSRCRLNVEDFKKQSWPTDKECELKKKFYFSTQTYVLGTKKRSEWGDSFEHPKHIFKLETGG